MSVLPVAALEVRAVTGAELTRSKAELGNLQCAVGLPEIPSVTLPEEMHAASDEAAKTRAQLAGSNANCGGSMCGGKWCE